MTMRVVIVVVMGRGMDGIGSEESPRCSNESRAGSRKERICGGKFPV